MLGVALLGFSDQSNFSRAFKPGRFDKSTFLGRLGGDEELLKQIAEMFIEDASGYMKALRDALEKQDASEVRQIAHALKGSSANINASALQKVASEMETAGEKGNLDQADALFKKMEAEFVKLKGVLADSSI